MTLELDTDSLRLHEWLMRLFSRFYRLSSASLIQIPQGGTTQLISL